MLAGLSGSLVSHYYAERILLQEFSGRLGEGSRAAAERSFSRWWLTQASQLGPASSIRSIWDMAAAPLVELLGFTAVHPMGTGADVRHAPLVAPSGNVALVAATWNVSLDNLWRDATRRGVGLDAAWVLCTNGRELRLVDTQRTYSRAYLQFDLQQAALHPPSFAVLWALMRADAFRREAHASPLILDVIRSSARHGQAVSRSLRVGVIESVEHLLGGLNKCSLSKHELPRLFDESLTVVYRVLFLMFAESRSLVPNWHPIYRESYTIESLRDRAERPGTVPGLWEALQAIARLAHKGCRAGNLVVPPFNGRLFSPARSPIAESCAVDDEVARTALLALSTTTAGRPGRLGRLGRPKGRHYVQPAKRTRIDYRDLGVEQLGAVYESVLDYEPAYADARRTHVRLRRGGQARKSTGSFYTPQTLTDYLVRRTLHPLVDGAPADRILQLRVVDPAMGSAAFLVSACRYLARAYERALVRDGSAGQADVDETDRATFRRLVAQRCLFGVDLNPTAVQLARLSLWLATLSVNKPLTFLDHHLLCGNSLIGASPVDIARQPPGSRLRASRYGAQARSRRAGTPLFSDVELEPSLARAVAVRRWLAETLDDTADVVREKERRLDRLRKGARWKSVADLWCAGWVWPDPRKAPDPAVFASLADKLMTGRCELPDKTAETFLRDADGIAAAHRFFHWMLEFPEAYFDDAGHALADGGFDAVLGNPPWDMLRAGGAEKTFFRSSGVYRHQGAGHINRYQLFVERALALTKRGGRIGLVLPAGFSTDHTSAPLRRALLSRASIDTISGFDNRRAIFPIHRSVRFLICTSTVGDATQHIACRFGIDDPAELETIPDSGDRPAARSHPIALTPSFLEALSGDRVAIPELRIEVDMRILERVVHTIPRLSAADGWGVRFGRELNATDDRRHFHSIRAGLPVLEGKHIEPFRAHPDRAGLHITEHSAGRLLDAAATFSRARLAYRDVASSTNRLSLIAAVLPPRVVTTHSLFCLKTALSGDNQAFLCAMLNSYVANYLVRQVMTTHLGSATVEALRVPKPRYDSPLFQEIVELAHQMRLGPDERAHARLQALAARCYGLTQEEFSHVVTTFPLIDLSERTRALEEFRVVRLLG
jgi:N-6 DNA Methylase/Eco57I restriction-modification methylase